MQTKFRLKSLRSDQTHILDKASILIGRSSQCDIQVDSGLLSRHHASVLVVDAETVLLKDLESTNGTFVNTMRITRPARLRHGDVITIGDEKFVFIDLELGEEQAAPSAVENHVALGRGLLVAGNGLASGQHGLVPFLVRHRKTYRTWVCSQDSSRASCQSLEPPSGVMWLSGESRSWLT